ncbi:MAG: DUF6537 domain-containing protein, partial [Rhodospirillaceae bacterium]
SHIRIAKSPEDLHAVRIATGACDLLLGCDMVTRGSYETLSKLQAGRTRAVVNGQRTMTADFTRDPDRNFPERRLHKALYTAIDDRETGGPDSRVDFVEATQLARDLLGDTIGANLFVVGYAYQKGLLPVDEAALHAAIDLNGVATAFNKQAFLWGRRAAHDPAAVAAIIGKASTEPAAPASDDLDGFIERRVADLTAYQNAAYGAQYRQLVAEVASAEAVAMPGRHDLTEAAAKALYKVMAIKDEYEVARLFTDGRFERAVYRQFADGARLTFHLAPPLFAERDPRTGRLRKKEYGAWIFPVLRVLAGLKGLRGTVFDIFGRTEERAAERRHRADYVGLLRTIVDGLGAANYDTAVDLARLPLAVRGFGHVWDANLKAAQAREPSLLAAFKAPGSTQAAAE